MPDNRPSPRVGPVEFSVYGGRTQPFVDVDTENRYETLEPIGTDPVRQFLGPKLDEITIVGDCSPDEADQVDDLEGEVEVRTARWNGVATVDSTSTQAQQKKLEGEWIYKYNIKLTEGP